MTLCKELYHPFSNAILLILAGVARTFIIFEVNWSVLYKEFDFQVNTWKKNLHFSVKRNIVKVDISTSNLINEPWRQIKVRNRTWIQYTFVLSTIQISDIIQSIADLTTLSIWQYSLKCFQVARESKKLRELFALDFMVYFYFLILLHVLCLK